jgi:hypothetical protein
MGKTRAKKSDRPPEDVEADRIETALLYLAASDYRPVVAEYALAPSEAQLPWLMGEYRAKHAGPQESTPLMTARYLGAVMHPVGNIPGIIAAACRQLTREEWARKLALLPRATVRALGSSGGFQAVDLRYARIKPDGRVNHGLPTTLVDTPLPGLLPRGRGYREWFPLSSALAPNDGDFVTYPDVVDLGWRFLDGNWSVSFAAGIGPSVRVPACADSVAGLFALRDRPEGRTRRQALRHWVRAHSRRLPDARECDVTGHLRGAEEFDWFGLRCRVVPPAALRPAQKAG